MHGGDGTAAAKDNSNTSAAATALRRRPICLLDPLTNSRLMNLYPTSEGLVDSDLSAEFLAFPIHDATVPKSGPTEPPPLFYFVELRRQTFELPG